MVRISWGWEQQRLVMIKSVKISTVSFWYVFYLLEALFWLLKNKQGTTILGSNKVISESSTHTCLVHFSSVAQSCLTLCNPMNHSTPGLPVHHQLPEFTQTHVHWIVMPSNHLILCRPLLLLPSIFPSIRVFSKESALCLRWPKYWSFSFNISPSNEHLGLSYFRMDWLDLLTIQGTLKSLLQHHSSKASILHCSGFFIVQLSHPYMTSGKTLALTTWTFVSAF